MRKRGSGYSAWWDWTSLLGVSKVDVVRDYQGYKLRTFRDSSALDETLSWYVFVSYSVHKAWDRSRLQKQ